MKFVIVILVVVVALYCEAKGREEAYTHQGEHSSASGTGVSDGGGPIVAGGCSKDGKSCTSSISVGGGRGSSSSSKSSSYSSDNDK